jgi:hypothetical protein
VLVQGNGKLAIVGADGEVEWDMPWGPIHDLHVLAKMSKSDSLPEAGTPRRAGKPSAVWQRAPTSKG